MIRTVIAAALLAVFLVTSGTADAQTQATERPREVALSVGAARLWHGDDVLGSGTTLGGEFKVHVLPRLAVRIEGHESFGPDLQEWSCARETLPCSGIAHTGVRDLIIWSGNALYYFGSGTVRAFAVGGLDVLHFTVTSSVTTVRNGRVTITEIERTDTTMGVTFGGGVRVPVGGRISITPEVKIYDGTLLAGANLSQLRTSLAVGYRW